MLCVSIVVVSSRLLIAGVTASPILLLFLLVFILIIIVVTILNSIINIVILSLLLFLLQINNLSYHVLPVPPTTDIDIATTTTTMNSIVN